MRFRNPQENQTASPNLTPMIDVVFLLIIFFLVSSNLVQQEVSVPMELPNAETGTIEEEAKNKRLTINIPESSKLLIGTTPLTRDKLRRLFQRYAEEMRKDGSKPEIRIRTGQDIQYGEIEPILVLAAETGIADVSFAVKSGEQ